MGTPLSTSRVSLPSRPFRITLMQERRNCCLHDYGSDERYCDVATLTSLYPSSKVGAPAWLCTRSRSAAAVIAVVTGGVRRSGGRVGVWPVRHQP